MVEYTNVSFEPMIELDQLLRASFASGLDSPRWDRIRHIDDWYLDNTCPDGLMVDFGDSWAKKGYSVMGVASTNAIAKGDYKLIVSYKEGRFLLEGAALTKEELEEKLGGL